MQRGFGVKDCRDGDPNAGFAAAHFAVDDGGTLAAIAQQFSDGVDDLALGVERLPLQPVENELPVRARLPGVDGRIGTVEGLQQLVTELGNEVGQADGERRRFLVEQGIDGGRAIDGIEIERQWGDAP